jgi:signal transduction histidine kinase
VSVADEGVGIPIERQAQIFERYYRAHAGTPQDYGGLGLGLEMSREVVERQGGRMWFESNPGAGSTFHFGLPLQREDA